MTSRFEYNIQTNILTEVRQRIYQDASNAIVIVDDGVAPPDGFIEVFPADDQQKGSDA